LDEATKLLGEDVKKYRQEGGVLLENLSGLIEKIISFGVEIVAATDGANGAWVGAKVSGELIVYYLPGEKIEELRDTTGAGDAFVSGFLGMFIFDENELEMKFTEKLQRALAGGLVNSSAVIQEVGATKGFLKESRLKRAVKKKLKDIQEV
jgi:sugar/nucleoside kinase (ribokinase family)